MNDEVVIKLIKKNEVHFYIDCDTSTLYELNDAFSFFIKDHKHHPLVKKRLWDGKIRLVNLMARTVYVGLLGRLNAFAAARNYTVEVVGASGDAEFSVIEAERFAKTLGLPFEMRDYQISSLVHCVRKSRAIILSPTASGKSLIIYSIFRRYNKKTLIIVPNVGLIGQLAGDFVDYGYQGDIHTISAGADKQTDILCTISTWQSLIKQPAAWFDQFDVVVVDEVHGAKAKSLTDIMEKLTKCKYRFGFTGTLDGIQCNELTLEGLFGSIKRFVTTSELMERGEIADLLIKVLVLHYDDPTRFSAAGLDYHSEMDKIVRLKSRNTFIKNLTLSLKGNTILLYHFVDKHGQALYEAIEKEAVDRKVFFVHGGVDGDERNAIRKIVETESNAIIVASDGTFSKGTNIKNINNVILSSPGKGKILTLQSIGRGLRLSPTKTELTLFDVVDDLTWNKQNYTLNHSKERIKIYNSEGFKHKIYTIEIKE